MSAAALRALHVPGDPLVLPNAWDAGSARLVERAGFPVVATTSSGVADALGYADGEQTPAEEMLAAVRRIARAVSVPVTADMEAGYGIPGEELTARVLGTGAVGLNLRTPTMRASRHWSTPRRTSSGSRPSSRAATSCSTAASTSSSAAARWPTASSAPAATPRRGRLRLSDRRHGRA